MLQSAPREGRTVKISDRQDRLAPRLHGAGLVRAVRDSINEDREERHRQIDDDYGWRSENSC